MSSWVLDLENLKSGIDWDVLYKLSYNGIDIQPNPNMEAVCVPWDAGIECNAKDIILDGCGGPSGQGGRVRVEIPRNQVDRYYTFTIDPVEGKEGELLEVLNALDIKVDLEQG
jgi:hypothetical protein